MTVPEDSDLSREKHTKTTLESLRVCLFSNHESDGVKKNLDYMRQKYNFTILDIECLINLKGLLAYIAERIQLGKLCLFCSKQFRSAERAQQHMKDKGHCMMPYDKDDEFGVFYDFSRAYRELPQKAMITASGEESKSATGAFTATEERKIERNQRMAGDGNDDDGGNIIEANDSGSDDWEDVDCDDGDSMEDVQEVNENEEESSE